MSTLDKKHSYADLIAKVTKPMDDDDRKRKNSSDDFGVKRAGYYYHRLEMSDKAKGGFYYQYAKPTQQLKDLALPFMCEGSIGSIKYLAKSERVDCAAIVVCDQLMIGRLVINLIDIVAEFEPIN